MSLPVKHRNLTPKCACCHGVSVPAAGVAWCAPGVCVSLLPQEIPLFSTLPRSTVGHASEKQGPYCMSECLKTQTPQKLSLSLLHVCQE